MGFPAKRDGWVIQQQQQQLLQPRPPPPPPLPPPAAAAAYPLLPSLLPYSSSSKKKYDAWQHSNGFYPPQQPYPKRAAAAAAAVPCSRYKSHSNNRKHHSNNNGNNSNSKQQRNRAPCAPYNTSSYLMRAGKLGINAPLLSPTTPALDELLAISPAPWPQESLGDGLVANELGVNAYGSMNGRIRLRAADQGAAAAAAVAADRGDRGGDSEGGFSSCGESDTDHCEQLQEQQQRQRAPADSVQQVEERIEHGLQRFEILMAELPSSLEQQQQNHRRHLHHHGPVVRDQETHIAQLEEENLYLQQRLWAMSQELLLLRRQLGNQAGGGAAAGAHETASDESLGNGSCAA